jgi:hypothetical protein
VTVLVSVSEFTNVSIEVEHSVSRLVYGGDGPSKNFRVHECFYGNLGKRRSIAISFFYSRHRVFADY